MKITQLTFADMEIAQNRKTSRVSVKLDQINSIVNWEQVLEVVSIVDRTDKVKGDCPHKDLSLVQETKNRSVLNLNLL